MNQFTAKRGSDMKSQAFSTQFANEVASSAGVSDLQRLEPKIQGEPVSPAITNKKPANVNEHNFAKDLPRVKAAQNTSKIQNKPKERKSSENLKVLSK